MQRIECDGFQDERTHCRNSSKQRRGEEVSRHWLTLCPAWCYGAPHAQVQHFCSESCLLVYLERLGSERADAAAAAGS